MGIKDFDLKQVLVQKGERIALGVAAALMALMLIFGVGKGIGSGTSAGTAQTIKDLATSVDRKIASSQPPEQDQDPAAEFIRQSISFWRVDPEPFAITQPLFTPSSLEDTKRRNPDILAPTEFQADVVLGGIRGYVFNGRGQILVLEDKDLKTQLGMGQRFRGMGGMPGMGGKGMGGMAGAGSGGMMGMGRGSRGGGGEAGMGDASGSSDSGSEGAPPNMEGGYFGQFNQLGLEGPKKKYSFKYVDIDKLDATPNAKLAEQIYPQAIAVINASFPLKQQLEEFRRALRKKSMYELMELVNSEEGSWQFKGVEVKRRVLDAHGKVLQDWDEKYTEKMLEALRHVDALSVGTEQPDPKLLQFPGVVNQGLVAGLPRLAREGQKYPDLHLKGIEDSLAKLEEANKDKSKPVLSFRAEKLKGQQFDPFNPFGSADQGTDGAGPAGMMPGAAPGMAPVGSGAASSMGMANQRRMMIMMNRGMPGSPGAPVSPGGPEGAQGDVELPEPIVPDMCLLRFIDVNIEPGKTYEYQIRVKMSNPNYNKKKDVAFRKLAEVKELESAWVPVDKPVRVEVPPTILYYAVDEKPPRGVARPEPANQERTPVQIHRWFGWLLTNPENAQSSAAVADWVIAERQLVQRGEYIGRVERVKVPIWLSDWDSFVLAKDKNRQKQIPVDFSTKPSRNSPPALLVDFEGGKVANERIGNKPYADEAPLQVLILTSDGKLVVHNREADTADEARKKRVEDRRKWIEEVEKKKAQMIPRGNLFDRGPGGAGPGSGSGT